MRLTGCGNGTCTPSPLFISKQQLKENINMNRIVKLILIVFCANFVLPSLSGCSTEDRALLNQAASDSTEINTTETNAADRDGEDKEISEGSSAVKEDEEKDDKELSEDIYREDAEEIFAEMSDWRFIFSSGAGGWSTELSVSPDGSFFGSYSDSEMGSTGPGYDNGTLYKCDFSGKFSKDVRAAGPLMHALKIESIEYSNEPGTEEIKDNILYIYTEPYGLEGLDTIQGYDAPLVFMEAGAVTSALNEEEMSWVSVTHFGCYLGENWDYVADVPEELPYAVLINTVDQYAFFTENISEKNKTFLVNRVKIPGVKNTGLTINDDGTYYCVDENTDGSFKVINTCFKAEKLYDARLEADELVSDSLKEIYGNNAPDPDTLYVSSPAEAYPMQYSEMAVNGEYTAYANWKPKGYEMDPVYCDGRFLAQCDYESGTSIVYAYIIEADRSEDTMSYPDAGFSKYYITSLMLTGRTDRISSSGEGKGAIRAINCDMRLSEGNTVAARELIMVGTEDKELIKKYHLEDADFYDDYEIVAVDDEYREYRLAEGSETPFYMQYPEDGFHRLFQAFELDRYINRYSDDPDNSCLMYLYLNEDDEVAYGYEVYTP